MIEALKAAKKVSTHSHPKVAAQKKRQFVWGNNVSTHSHPKVAALGRKWTNKMLRFQHTATRRWLPSKTKSFRF